MRTADTWVVYWCRERCLMAQRQAGNARLELLFGGPHQSHPGMRKFGVWPGDRIYPVTVREGTLYVLGCMEVARLLSLGEYLAENARRFAPYRSRYGPSFTLAAWARANDRGYLVWSCTDDVAEGTGTPLRFDRALPPEMLERLRFRSKAGELPPRHLAGGRLTSTVSLQGLYRRLAPASAQDFAALVEDAASS